jgi:hypothetical protein
MQGIFAPVINLIYPKSKCLSEVYVMMGFDIQYHILQNLLYSLVAATVVIELLPVSIRSLIGGPLVIRVYCIVSKNHSPDFLEFWIKEMFLQSFVHL